MGISKVGGVVSLGDPTSGLFGTDTAVYGLDNGSVLVTGFDNGTKAQIFSADGTIEGDAFTVASSDNGLDAVLPVAGGFVIAVETGSGGSNGEAFALQRFDDHGSAIGAAITPDFQPGMDGSPDTYRDLAPSLFLGSDGSVVVDWAHVDQAPNYGSGSAWDYRTLQTESFSAAGAVTHARYDASLVINGPAVGFSFAELGSGAFLSTFTNPEGALAGQLFDGKGYLLGSSFQISTNPQGSDIPDLAKITPLAGGGAVVQWTEYSTIIRADTLSFAQEVDASGHLVGSIISDAEAVLALPDGGFVVANLKVLDSSYASYTNELDLQQYDASGKPLGDPVVVATGDLHGISMTTLDGGGFEIGWQAYIFAADGSITTQLEAQQFAGVQAATPGDDHLRGTSSADTLYGEGGNDTLSGLAGNDTLDGGLGHDTLIGGTGDDTYIVDSGHDTVTENANEGIDTVIAATSWTLGANLENLTLSGERGNSGTGNELDNHIVGNAGANTLTGLGGNDVLDGGTGYDTLVGGTGNDTYVVDSGHDKVVENAGEGTDTVVSAVSWTLGANLENLTLSGARDNAATGNAIDNTITGNAGANHLYGMAGNDTISGGNGNDVIQGGAGLDIVTGGKGQDTFVFAEGDLAGVKQSDCDRIADFQTGWDRIDLHAIDAVKGGADDAFTFIGTAAFDGHAGELRYFTSHGDAYLEMDTDGDKQGDLRIALDHVSQVTAADFVL